MSEVGRGRVGLGEDSLMLLTQLLIRQVTWSFQKFMPLLFSETWWNAWCQEMCLFSYTIYRIDGWGIATHSMWTLLFVSTWEIWRRWEANKWYSSYESKLFLISLKIYNFQTASKLGYCIIKHLTFVQLKLLTHTFFAPPSNYYSATADLTIFSISYK